MRTDGQSKWKAISESYALFFCVQGGGYKKKRKTILKILQNSGQYKNLMLGYNQ